VRQLQVPAQRNATQETNKQISNQIPVYPMWIFSSRIVVTAFHEKMPRDPSFISSHLLSSARGRIMDEIMGSSPRCRKEKITRGAKKDEGEKKVEHAHDPAWIRTSSFCFNFSNFIKGIH
jgi:hypothetical protein